MSTIDSIHLAAGRCLETSQQLEVAIATALLAADGARSGTHANIRDERYLKLLHKLDKMTLGRALEELETRVPSLRGSAHILEIALKARNRLAHEIFAGKPLRERQMHELPELLAELEFIALNLEGGKCAAEKLAFALVSEHIDAAVQLRVSGWLGESAP